MNWTLGNVGSILSVPGCCCRWSRFLVFCPLNTHTCTYMRYFPLPSLSGKLHCHYYRAFLLRCSPAPFHITASSPSWTSHMSLWCLIFLIMLLSSWRILSSHSGIPLPHQRRWFSCDRLFTLHCSSLGCAWSAVSDLWCPLWPVFGSKCLSKTLSSLSCPVTSISFHRYPQSWIKRFQHSWSKFLPNARYHPP